VQPGLVLKIMVQRAESAFEIRYVGSRQDGVDAPARPGSSGQ
jgi:hypothetical protein